MGLGCNLLFLSEKYIGLLVDDVQQCHYRLFYLLLRLFCSHYEVVKVFQHCIILFKFGYNLVSNFKITYSSIHFRAHGALRVNR